jgi:hypothetical protein
MAPAAPSATTSGHEKCGFGQLATHVSLKDLIGGPAGVRDHLDAECRQGILQRPRHGAADQDVDVEVGHVRRSRPEVSVQERFLAASDFGAVLDVHDEQTLADVQNRRNPVGPYGQCNFHCRRREPESCQNGSYFITYYQEGF